MDMAAQSAFLDAQSLPSFWAAVKAYVSAHAGGRAAATLPQGDLDRYASRDAAALCHLRQWLVQVTAPAQEREGQAGLDGHVSRAAVLVCRQRQPYPVAAHLEILEGEIIASDP